MKLQAKMLMLLVPLIVVPIVALGVVGYVQLRETSERDALDKTVSLAEQVALYARSQVDTAKANIELFSRSNLLERYIVIDDEAQRFEVMQPSLMKLFARFQKTYPEYYEIRILLPDGYEDTRSVNRDVPNVTEQEGETQYFQSLLHSESSLTTMHHVNPDNEEFSLLIVKKLELRDPAVDPVLAKPRLRGYLVVTVDLDFLRQQALNSRLGKRGAIFFTDRRGRILFHPDGRKENTYLDPNLMLQVLEQPASEEDIHKYDVDGEQAFVHAVPIGNNMLLMSVLPQAELLAAGRKLGLLVTVITLVSVVLTTLLLFSALKSLLLTPIGKLERASKEIGRGNLDIEIDLARQDELGDLAKSFEEMSENLRRSGDQVQYLAYHDSLTGLPNRRMFRDYLIRALEQAKRDGQSLALLFLDLDDFKRVNDTLGHQYGDKLLQEVANRVSHCVRASDYLAERRLEGAAHTVARLGGDEFMVMLPNLQYRTEAEAVATRVLESLSEKFKILNREFKTRASIGITVYPLDGTDVDTLIRNADIAMYAAKEQGKGNCQFFSESMKSSVLERMALEDDLRTALDRNEFIVHYQPQVDARTGKLTGVEALVRWQHPKLGIIGPEKFIGVAEEAGLIVPLGEYVLRRACVQASKWQKAGLQPIRMAVNISNLQLERVDLRRTVQDVLMEAGLGAQYLELELTESNIMHVDDTALETLHALRRLGVQISLDDFGTGYSSLSSLKNLPISTLKIDRSFVEDITTDADGAVIINAIIAMARSLNLSVTAEGVEEFRQLAYLRSAGCDTIQGYLVGRPVAADRISSLYGDALGAWEGEPKIGSRMGTSIQENERKVYNFAKARWSKTLSHS